MLNNRILEQQQVFGIQIRGIVQKKSIKNCFNSSIVHSQFKSTIDASS